VEVCAGPPRRGGTDHPWASPRTSPPERWRRPVGHNARVTRDGTPDIAGVSHIDLSVSDRERSARWYQSVLGFEVRGHHLNQTTGLPWTHLTHRAGLNLALVEHPDNTGEPFDERRCGLDHLSFELASRADLEAFRRRTIEAGIPVPPVVDTETVSVIVLRDPDNIQIELCAWRAAPT
jgi:glyoxylase I family protein